MYRTVLHLQFRRKIKEKKKNLWLISHGYSWWLRIFGEWDESGCKKNCYFSFLLEELKDNGSKTSSIFLIILSMYVCIIILSTDIQEHEFKSWSDFVSWKMLKLKASLLFSKVHKQSIQTKVYVATIDGTAENLISIKY